MLKRLVYKEEELLGEVDLYLLTQNVELRERDIRITHFSQPGERCSPLAVLHTITSCGLCFKMESKMVSPDSPLFTMHSSCFRENKTAVMPLGSREELHLVAVSAGRNGIRYPCFWGFMTVPGLYSSCVCMLNLRCLGIVFDLDETLVVANTSRSFEDKIDSLQRKISAEADPQRVSAMLSEVKRYQEDKMMLKQYAETDQVVENGKIMRIQPEVFPALSDNHQPIIRPIIRLPEKNIILTRINPVIRDTSVLVRLRPGWEELRSYLTARGRKRFEVYVCTMAERDYALEMWRLLDPDSNLMNTNNLLDRIVCVKSGSKKSLLNVFQNGSCDPKMALVIDDRLRVWDERDQPRVHVVPAFAPYHSPQARENSSIPVLCVARNVACNVRGCFFRDFDDDLLQRISKVSYEDDIRSVPSQDVGNYLVSEDDGGATTPNGMADVEIDRGLKESACSDPRILSSAQCTVSSSSPSPSLSCPVLPVQCCAREEGEVPESELDPDTRRRLLILQHGQDTRDHQSTAESSMNPRAPLLPPPPPPPLPSWFPIEEAMSPGHNFSEPVTKKILMDIDPIDRHRNLSRTWFAGQGSSRFTNERDERLRWNRPPLGYRSESGPGQHCSPSPSPVSALNKISIRCGAKVEYRSSLVDSDDLNFLVQVLFSDEKVGEGSGRTRREAQRRAAELAIKTLAFKYLSNIRPDSNGLTDPRMDGSGWALAPPDTRHRKPGPVQDDLEAGILWDDVKVKTSQFPHRRSNDPVQEVPGKRIKPEMPRFVPRMPSGRYSRNAPPPPGL